MLAETQIYRFSSESASLKRSIMRELIQLTARPGVISLAGGLPPDKYLPTEALRECVQQVISRDQAKALQYGPQYMPLRVWIADMMNSRGVACKPEEVFITNGNQQGLYILSRLFLDSGDSAVTEAITFTGIQQITAGRGANIRAVPVEDDGVDVYALTEAFKERPKPRLAVLIPDFHNPLGVSMSAAKRRNVAELAARYQIPLIEDDPYSLLRFQGELPPPVRTYDETGHVFYLGSFSKILAPALRLGWLIAPESLIPRITVIRESIDLESSGLIQRAAFAFLERGLLESHLWQLTKTLQGRAAALLDALGKHMSHLADWTQPEGGLFIWLNLHDPVDTREMLADALAEGVAYAPGAAFAIHGDARRAMRLNFSNLQPDQFDPAVRRLANVIEGKRMSLEDRKYG